VGADHIQDVARDARLGKVETWTVEGRWFASISRCHVVSSLPEPSAGALPEPSAAALAEPDVLALLRNDYR